MIAVLISIRPEWCEKIIENDNFLANSDEADIYGLLEMAGVEVRHGG